MDEQMKVYEIEMQPGETVMLKAKAEGGFETIDPKVLKKSKRNIAKEAEWQKKKYKRFTFTVDRLKAEQFIEALEQLGKTPLEWFKEQIENHNPDTVTVDNPDTVTAVKPKRKISPKATVEEIIGWHEQKLQGMTWKQIAEPLGRDYNGVRKAVEKYRKKD